MSDQPISWVTEGARVRAWILGRCARFYHYQVLPQELLLPRAEFEALKAWATIEDERQGNDACLAADGTALLRVPTGPLRVSAHDGPRAWTFPEAW